MLMASVLGVLKSGAAYLLIDGSLPHDRIEYMLNDSKTVFLITNSKFDKYRVNYKLLIDEDTEILEKHINNANTNNLDNNNLNSNSLNNDQLDNLNSIHYFSDLANMSDKNPICNSSNEDTFNIIYTSGSTGNPKGVALRRLGVINMILSYKHLLHTDECDTFLSISAVSFDMFIVENFVSLFTGKTVVLSNEEEQKIPIYTNNLIKNII